jgi:hypothetical protein
MSVQRDTSTPRSDDKMPNFPSECKGRKQLAVAQCFATLSCPAYGLLLQTGSTPGCAHSEVAGKQGC